MHMNRRATGAAHSAVSKSAQAKAIRPSGLTIDLAVEGGAWPDIETMRALIGRALEAVGPVLAHRGHDTCLEGELSVLLTDDDTIRDLNQRFRGRAVATNVLSFPAAGLAGPHTPALGDIAIAFETVAREAAAQALTIDHHVSHLVIHGFLHILGFDHQNDVHAAQMERLEIEILAGLGIADPYRDVAGNPASADDNEQ